MATFLDNATALTRPTWWARVGVFVLGVALIIFGLVLITTSSKVVQDVAKKAIDTTPQGAAIDAATTAVGA
mgnify:CR=1 FL=1